MFSGACTNIEGVPIEGLIPKTDHYMTYSGSLTQPGCQETVTWIIYNKPLYLSRNQVCHFSQFGFFLIDFIPNFIFLNGFVDQS